MDGALPQTLAQGFLSGLAHPLIGLDHAAFIIAAGVLLAALRGGLWGLVALVVGTLGGAALHLAGLDIPYGEIGVALSVVLAGALVAAGRRIPLAALAAGLACAGLLHGHAYAESIFGAEATPLGAYLVGFSLIQLAVGTTAFLAQRRFAAATWRRPLARALGAVVGATGAVFLLLNLAG